MRIELTGPTCSGKSNYIRLNKIESVKIPLPYTVLGLVTLGFKKPRALFFLLRRIFRSDKSFYHVLRVFLHVFAKVGHFYFAAKNAKCWVDEGLSHIPFILMLNTGDLHVFMEMFSHELRQVHIFFTVTSPEKISRCLSNRGHKRIRSAKDFEKFMSNHVRLMSQYYSILIAADFKVTQIEV